MDEIVNLCNYQEFGARKVDQIIAQKIDSIVIEDVLLGKRNISIKSLN